MDLRRLTFALATAAAVALFMVPAAFGKTKPKATLSAGCSSVRISYEGLPPGVTGVSETIAVKGSGGSTIERQTDVEERGEDRVSLAVPPGKHSIVVHVLWHNGAQQGHLSAHGKIECALVTALSVELCVRPERGEGAACLGTGHEYVLREQQTVDYVVAIKNEGNTPVSLRLPTDEHEDAFEGDVSKELLPGAKTPTFAARRFLPFGEYTIENQAFVLATPAIKHAQPFSSASNIVVTHMEDR